MTFFTGPAAVLGEPSYKGHILAAEEINTQGGFLGKRKIETVKADEAAGTDANVKELRRLKLSEGIDWFTGIISSLSSSARQRCPWPSSYPIPEVWPGRSIFGPCYATSAVRCHRPGNGQKLLWPTPRRRGSRPS